MAGKGGIGKTVVMATLAEWFQSKGISVEMFDMDPENKAEGSLASLFSKAVKMPATETWTYDRLLGISMESPADVILADMGAAQAHRMIPWVQDFYRAAQKSGLPLRWTAIGVVDGDIASARSVLEWGAALQTTVDYIVVHNNCLEGRSAWSDPMIATDVQNFCSALNPIQIRMEPRRPDLQSIMRARCVTLGDVANRKTQISALRSPDMMLRARGYRKNAFDQFTLAHEVLLP
jgi:CobQ/CobB/MinD/ParA family nucleotide binding protein